MQNSEELIEHRIWETDVILTWHWTSEGPATLIAATCGEERE